MIKRPDFVSPSVRNEGDFEPETLMQFLSYGPVLEKYRTLIGPVTASGCAEWLGPKNPRGYGILSAAGVILLAHRVAWILVNDEPIPAGFMVCHKCDSPPCVNYPHLLLGTAADNIHDMWSKGRAGIQKGEVKVGRLPHLTTELVAEIRTSNDDTTSLSIRFGFPYGVIYAARHGMTWKHLKDPPPQSRKFARTYV